MMYDSRALYRGSEVREVIRGSLDPMEIKMNLPNPFPAGLQNAVQVTTPKFKFKTAGTAGTLIAVILDESGSMESARGPTIAGFNEYVAGQKSVENAGDAFMTLVKFDAPHIKTVFVDRPIVEVPDLSTGTYMPNGGTNLLDAIGFTIENVNNSLASRKKDQRPGVIIIITTDGFENSSTKYNNEQIKAMVKAAEKADWSFVFMGANIDSFAAGSTFGMSSSNSVNYSTSKMSGTYDSLNATTSRMRSAKMAGTNTADIYASAMFTDTEKKNMV